MNEYLDEMERHKLIFDRKALRDWVFEYGCQCSEKLGENTLEKKGLETAKRFMLERLENILSKSKELYWENPSCQGYDIKEDLQRFPVEHAVELRLEKN